MYGTVNEYNYYVTLAHDPLVLVAWKLIMQYVVGCIDWTVQYSILSSILYTLFWTVQYSILICSLQNLEQFSVLLSEVKLSRIDYWNVQFMEITAHCLISYVQAWVDVMSKCDAVLVQYCTYVHMQYNFISPHLQFLHIEIVQLYW